MSNPAETLTHRLRTLLSGGAPHPRDDHGCDPPDPESGTGLESDPSPVEAGSGPIRSFGRAHAAGLAVVLAVTVVAALTLTLRAQSQTVPLTAQSAEQGSPAVQGESSSPARSGSSAPAAPHPNPNSSAPTASSNAQVIQVHVAGQVRRPGVVRLPAGSRVHDAIAAAGGATPSADLNSVNLAAMVSDGSQVVIGELGQHNSTIRADPAATAAEPTTASGSAAPVNINTATQAQLEELPGVGPVTAKNILSWREQHGAFSRVEELQEVDGIGPKTYAQLAPHVTV